MWCEDSNHAHSAKLTENIIAEAASVTENPGVSISRHSQEIGHIPNQFASYLHKDLDIKAYKIQLTEKIKPADHEQHCMFVNWVLEMSINDPNFFKEILWATRPIFTLTSWHLSKQNFRIWGSENLTEIIEQPLGFLDNSLVTLERPFQ